MFKLSSLPIFVLSVALLGLTACDGGAFDGNVGRTCSTNPYLPGCTDPIYEERRVYYCSLTTDPEDSPDPQCVTINVVDTRDIDGYTTLPANFAGVNTDGATTNGFVQITGSVIATTGLTNPRMGEDSLLNNDTSGYVYAVGEEGAIAGILPTTDVGAPHNNRTPTADWSGEYNLVNKTSAIATNRNITLKINFAPGTITGESGLTDGRNFSVDATFNPYGDISGTFSITADNANNIAKIDGFAQGLIGTEGAVGALHGNNTAGDNPVAGGFVATPQ